MDPWKDFEEGYIITSPGKIFYLQRPSTKKQVLFLHGLGASTKVWSKLVGALPSDVGIYLIDLLGHGKSDAPKMDYKITAQVAMLKEFISRTSLQSCTIFGHSYGGWIAARYASANNTKGLILEDAAGMPGTTASDGNPLHKEDLIKAASGGESSEDVITSIVEHMEDDMLTDDVLSKISCKTLVIWGDRDPLIDPKTAAVVQSKIKGSELIIVKDSGHNSHFSKAEEVASAISKFIE